MSRPEHSVTDHHGRVWTAENFALSATATMVSLDAFVDILRDGFGVTDPNDLMHYMALRNDLERHRPAPEGSDLDML